MNRLETLHGFFNVLDERKSPKLDDLFNLENVNCPEIGCLCNIGLIYNKETKF
jgi:hypothetical protein